MKSQEKEALRQKRHKRLRYKVSGTSERPRLNVSRSLQHIYAQLIDDTTGRTLTTASTVDPTLRASSRRAATLRPPAVGKLIAERAKEKGVSAVVFDRGGYKYHGRVQALADGAREAGLQF